MRELYVDDTYKLVYDPSNNDKLCFVTRNGELHQDLDTETCYNWVNALFYRALELEDALKAVRRQMDYPQHYNKVIDTVCKVTVGDN